MLRILSAKMVFTFLNDRIRCETECENCESGETYQRFGEGVLHHVLDEAEFGETEVENRAIPNILG